jgi:hypothetical protein
MEDRRATAQRVPAARHQDRRERDGVREGAWVRGYPVVEEASRFSRRRLTSGHSLARML